MTNPKTYSKMKSLPLAVLSAISVSAMFATVASAQTPAPTAPQKIEKIEVTGSNIKRVDAESSAPIQIITADDIKKSGATSVAEILRNLPIANAGSLNELATSNSFAIGASSISLRGLGAQATLVLLNGRRLASYGFANGGQQQVVNLDTIPTSVIERIEILKDGASAIYGSEAMAGVVNIILRKDYTGAEVTGNFSQNSGEDFRVSRGSGSIGYGDLAKDKFNAYLNVEYFKRDATKFRDSESFLTRPEYRALFGTGVTLSSNTFPGNYRRVAGTNRNVIPAGGLGVGPNVTAAGASIPFDQYADISIGGAATRKAAFGKATVDISPTLQAFVELAYSKNGTTFTSAPALLNEGGTSWFNLQTLGLNFLNLSFAPGNPNNPYSFPVGFRHRFSELGPTKRIVDTDATRVLGGLKGSFINWDWEFGALYSKSNTTATYVGQLRASTLGAAIADGTYNFISTDLNANSAALRSSISPNISNVGNSSFTSFDFKASRELFQLSGGALGLAFGVEQRNEKLNTTPGTLFSSSDIIGFGASSASGTRNVTSAYAELNAPFTTNLEAQLAVRTDRYSDYGRSTTPKLGVKWKVLSNWALRSTYAEGFRAPALPEISKSLSAGFYNNFQDPARCAVTGADADCIGSFPVLFGANTGLKAEESKSYNIGTVWEPTKDLSFTLDYYRISRKKEIALLDPTFLVQNESRFPGYIVRGPVDVAGIPGPIISFNSRYQNLGQTIVKGLDFESRYKYSLGEYGKLDAQLSANYVLSYKNSATESEALVEYNGTYNQPKIRAGASVSWVYGSWSVTPSYSYVGDFLYVGSPYDVCRYQGTANQFACKISSWGTWNLFISNEPIKDLTISLSIRNLEDKQPPFDARNATSMFNSTYHNPFGMYSTLSATYRFK